MKTLKIEIPKGYEIDVEKTNITDGSIVFKEIKKELPKSWEELGKLSGCYVGVNAELVQLTCPSIARSENRIIFATEEQAKASVALAQLSQLREVYRQGWKPNWSDGQPKYCIEFQNNGVRINLWYNLNYFLSFQSQEIASQFLENFSELIKKAKPLMS